MGGEGDWVGARWIAGPRDVNEWTDLTVTVRFRGTWDDLRTGVPLLVRAEAIGKAWNEALRWSIEPEEIGLSRRDVPRPRRAAISSSSTPRPAGRSVTSSRSARSGDGPHRTTVSHVGTADVSAPVVMPAAGRGLRDRPGRRLGSSPRVTRSTSTVSASPVSRVDDLARSVHVVHLEPPLQRPTGVGARVGRRGTGLRIAEPLPRDVTAGAVASGEGGFRLRMRTQHDLGQTWVDDGATEPSWGVDRYDSQAETNPVSTGVRMVDVGIVALPVDAGITLDSWSTREHELTVEVRGLGVMTSVNGVLVDERTLRGDEIRRRGAVGFAPRHVGCRDAPPVVDDTGAQPAVDLDLRHGANPFESGIGGAGGLTFVDKNAMLPIANPAPLLRTRQATARGPDHPRGSTSPSRASPT